MAGSSFDLDKIQRQGEQSLAPSSVKVRLYTGCDVHLSIFALLALAP